MFVKQGNYWRRCRHKPFRNITSQTLHKLHGVCTYDFTSSTLTIAHTLYNSGFLLCSYKSLNKTTNKSTEKVF